MRNSLLFTLIGIDFWFTIVLVVWLANNLWGYRRAVLHWNAAYDWSYHRFEDPFACQMIFVWKRLLAEINCTGNEGGRNV